MTDDVLWKTGDTWKDLGHEAAAAGAFTVVSSRGTARICRTRADGTWEHTRVPLEGGHQMYSDSRWQPLHRFTLTPCGLSVYGRGLHDYELGTPVRLVLTGEHPHWLTSPIGEQTRAQLFSERPTPDGHPPEACGAAYCTHRDRNS